MSIPLPPTMPMSTTQMDSLAISANSITPIQTNGAIPLIPTAPSVPPLSSLPTSRQRIKHKPRVEMKPLFWTIVPPSKIKGSLWEKLDDTKIHLNLDTLDDSFSLKKKDPPTQSNPPKPTTPSFLKPERTRMINIVLSRVRLQPLDIVEALETYRFDILTPLTCELILPIMPTIEEVTQVAKAHAEISELKLADQFVLILSTFVAYTERVKSLIFYYSYEEDVAIVLKEINRFYKVFDFIKGSDKLRKWFEIILAVGNFMNGGIIRGGAFAFRLDTIAKLSEIKSKDNKMNLMDYIVEYIMETLHQKDMFDILKMLIKFDKLQYQSIVETVEEMTKRFEDVKQLKKIIEDKKERLLPEDKSEAFLSKFYSKAEMMIKEINTKVEMLNVNYKEVLALLGEDPKYSIDVFIIVFKKFKDDIKNALDTYKKTKEKIHS